MEPLHSTGLTDPPPAPVPGNLQGPHFRGQTPLHQAAAKGHADVVKVLLAANAAVDAKDAFPYGRGPRGAEGGKLLLGRERSWAPWRRCVGPYSEGLMRVYRKNLFHRSLDGSCWFYSIFHVAFVFAGRPKRRWPGWSIQYSACHARELFNSQKTSMPLIPTELIGFCG